MREEQMCRVMLHDFFIRLNNKFGFKNDDKISLREVLDTIDEFMKEHNLIDKQEDTECHVCAGTNQVKNQRN
jgi:hypothetical protein